MLEFVALLRQQLFLLGAGHSGGLAAGDAQQFVRLGDTDKGAVLLVHIETADVVGIMFEAHVAADKANQFGGDVMIMLEADPFFSDGADTRDLCQQGIQRAFVTDAAQATSPGSRDLERCLFIQALVRVVGIDVFAPLIQPLL